jgi:hypothetical protein
MQEEKTLRISGTKKDVNAILGRLLEKYGKDARLIDVILKEYGLKEVNLS